MDDPVGRRGYPSVQVNEFDGDVHLVNFELFKLHSQNLRLYEGLNYAH
jgi:hypothetical protein